MDNAAWAALTLSLTVAGGIWTWFAFRHRGLGSGVRALGFTLLPLAAYLTNTLQLFTNVVSDISSWAGHLVFSPKVWLGVMIGGVAVLLLVVSGRLRARELRRGKSPDALPEGGATPAVRGGVPEDDDMAEIEALLRKRGIS